MAAGYEPPRSAHWLGTDALGRDVLARLASGTSETVAVIFLALAIATILGASVGFAAALSRRQWLRFSADTVVAAVFAAPSLLLVMLLISWVGAAWWVTPLVLGLFVWPPIAQAMTHHVLAESQKPWVLAANSLGGNRAWVWSQHLLPALADHLRVAVSGVLSPLLQSYFLASFLVAGSGGLGALIREGFQVYPNAWWIWLPAVGLCVTILGLALLLEGKRNEQV
jgi:peptide/nickel transport system permease protein